MSAGRLLSWRNPWVSASVGMTAAVAGLAAFLGFVLLPYAQPDLKLSGVWDAICSAAGVPRSHSDTVPIATAFKTSKVIVKSDMLGQPSALSVGRGATLALQCAICHGLDGASKAASPNLAGQYPAVIYKELKDFQGGARVNAVMGPFAAVLTEQDMQDLAAYYAYLPRLNLLHPDLEPNAPRIVLDGAPLRNIAPCASCHGGLDHKVGSPRLEGQPPVYIKAQLLAFNTGVRRNDISEQMRNIARQMTPTEIDEASTFYGSSP